jgi:hypothetical protein
MITKDIIGVPDGTYDVSVLIETKHSTTNGLPAYVYTYPDKIEVGEG